MSVAGIVALAGCGAWQATKDTTAGAAQWLFTKQVKTMNIHLDARAALNENGAGQSLSTVVRLYQPKDAKAFARVEYAQLQNDDLQLLKTDLVATKDVVIRPGASASVSEAMQSDAEYVGVAAFFRTPGTNGAWKLAIPKKQWKDTDPVKLILHGNTLELEGAEPKPVKHDAPQQSMPASAASAASAVVAASSASKAAVQNVSNTVNAVPRSAASALPQ